MISSHRLKRLVPAHFCFATFACLASASLLSSSISAQTILAHPTTSLLKFQPAGNQSNAVTSPDQSLLVTVYNQSSQPTKATWINDKKSSSLKYLGHDPITKLCFFKKASQNPSTSSTWKNRFEGDSPQDLTAITPAGTVSCRFDHWITEIDKKILPLSLLSVSFTGSVPIPGTPLIDSDSQIIGILLKKKSARSAYIIPAQAVHRVQQDISRHRKLVRSYLGLSLSTESSIPRIQRILPNSPAAKAGLKESDILVKVGPFTTERYPDAVNAFFYTAPGRPTTFEVIRNSERIPCKITPTVKR